MPSTRPRDLSDRLLPWIGMTSNTRDTADRLTKVARRYNRIEEAFASTDMPEQQVERLQERQDRLEAQMRDLMTDLPAPWFEEDDDHGSGAGSWSLYMSSLCVYLIALPPGTSPRDSYKFAGDSRLRVFVA